MLVHVNEFANARARREQMIKNDLQAKRPVDPAHRSNPRCASFLLQKDKGERGGNTGSHNQGKYKGRRKAGRKRMS